MRKSGNVSSAKGCGLCVVLILCVVFAIGQDGERKIKVWYDTPMGRLKSYSGR